jgi:hypothetical protein
MSTRRTSARLAEKPVKRMVVEEPSDEDEVMSDVANQEPDNPLSSAEEDESSGSDHEVQESRTRNRRPAPIPKSTSKAAAGSAKGKGKQPTSTTKSRTGAVAKQSDRHEEEPSRYVLLYDSPVSIGNVCPEVDVFTHRTHLFVLIHTLANATMYRMLIT